MPDCIDAQTGRQVLLISFFRNDTDENEIIISSAAELVLHIRGNVSDSALFQRGFLPCGGQYPLAAHYVINMRPGVRVAW